MPEANDIITLARGAQVLGAIWLALLILKLVLGYLERQSPGPRQQQPAEKTANGTAGTLSVSLWQAKLRETVKVLLDEHLQPLLLRLVSLAESATARSILVDAEHRAVYEAHAKELRGLDHQIRDLDNLIRARHEQGMAERARMLVDLGGYKNSVENMRAELEAQTGMIQQLLARREGDRNG